MTTLICTRTHACSARVMMDLHARGCYHDDRVMHGITTLQHMPKRAAAALAIALTLAGGVAGGFAARYVHLPLPWLLGALFTTMALSLAGAPVRLIPWGRPAGTVVVGASTGLQFTATVVAKLVTLLPMIIAAAFISTIVGAVGGLLYMRLTGIDRVTAFFATVPGGVVETTTIAPHYGGHLEPIMVAVNCRPVEAPTTTVPAGRPHGMSRTGAPASDSAMVVKSAPRSHGNGRWT